MRTKENHEFVVFCGKVHFVPRLFLRFSCSHPVYLLALWLVHLQKMSISLLKLLNAPVCLRIFIYKVPKMELGSVCRAHRAQSNGLTLRSLANFHIELEQFCCSLTAA